MYVKNISITSNFSSDGGFYIFLSGSVVVYMFVNTSIALFILYNLLRRPSLWTIPNIGLAFMLINMATIKNVSLYAFSNILLKPWVRTDLDCSLHHRFSGGFSYFDFSILLCSIAFRLIMVKYAKELIKEGLKLLKILFLLVAACFASYTLTIFFSVLEYTKKGVHHKDMLIQLCEGRQTTQIEKFARDTGIHTGEMILIVFIGSFVGFVIIVMRKYEREMRSSSLQQYALRKYYNIINFRIIVASGMMFFSADISLATRMGYKTYLTWHWFLDNLAQEWSLIKFILMLSKLFPDLKKTNLAVLSNFK